MKLDQLPDLSGWLRIETWTVEEAAMIWAAIDPMDHENVRLSDLKDAISPMQHKEARLHQRSILEAICAGTLSFVDSWEQHSNDNYNDNYHEWIEKVDFPKLPSHNKVVPYLTRIKQAAFLKWAESKNIQSLRMRLKKEHGTNTVSSDLKLITESEDNLIKPLAIAAPSYLDPNHPRYTVKLNASIRAWENNGIARPGRTIKQTGEDYLIENASSLGLLGKDGKPNNAAITEASTVANWDKKGGPAKSPGQPTPPLKPA